MKPLLYCHLLALFIFIHVPSGTALAPLQVSLPLKPLSNNHDCRQLQRQAQAAFQTVIDSSEFFVQCNSDTQSSKIICSVPALGNDIQLSFQPSKAKFVLSVESTSTSTFGWICVAFYEHKALFQDMVDTSDLYDIVVDHYNRQPPHPGFEANSAILAGSHKIEDLFPKGAVTKLEKDGFLILDNGPKSTDVQRQALSHYLVQKTNQGKDVRTDTVHFLVRDEATFCGFEEHFDTLMGIASFLNDNLSFRDSPHMPVRPATEECPLTIPNSVQLAEYGENDFYKAHSDNSLTCEFVKDAENNDRVRTNFRHYTCILYCNDDWNEEDGGALRLYPNTRRLWNADDAIQYGYDYIDVSPENGQIIIFDSCLIHSVEKVTHNTKKRRALTLWITRPDDSGVVGEQYF